MTRRIAPSTNRTSPRARARVAAQTTTHPAWWVLALGMALLLLLAAGSARAQEEFPRIGLSASPDMYVDHITVDFDSTFTLYAMVFGHAQGQPIGQPVTALPWVIHQVCCGGVLDLLDMQLNPALDHEGHPLAGMVSSSPECMDQDSIWLATLQVRVSSSVPGDFLWAAGPYGRIEDCEGTNPFFMAMPVTITVDGQPTPTTEHSWGQVKALYR